MTFGTWEILGRCIQIAALIFVLYIWWKRRARQRHYDNAKQLLRESRDYEGRGMPANAGACYRSAKAEMEKADAV